MVKKILVLYHCSQLIRAEFFQAVLRSKGFIPELVDVKFTELPAIYSAVDNNDLVIAILSQNLFDACSLKQVVEYVSSGPKEIITFIRNTDKVIYPTWYLLSFRQSSARPK